MPSSSRYVDLATETPTGCQSRITQPHTSELCGTPHLPADLGGVDDGISEEDGEHQLEQS